MRSITFSSSLFNKFLTAIAIIALVLVALPVRPVSAASITVNITDDENTSNGNCSLREAIIAANNNGSHNGCTYTGTGPDDIITLTSGLTYTLSIDGSSATTGDLDVGNAGGTSGNLTIQASGSTNAIVDANDINRVFEVDSPVDISLTLIHITVTNGNAPDGAGIHFDGAGTLTLMNSTVSSNTATGSEACGAGIYNNSSANINIMNSTIEGNSCATDGADGGGLFKGMGGTLAVTNSTFNDNTAADNGGGAHLDMLAGTAVITNSTFANNIAGARGGGIQVQNGTVTIQFSTFSGNAANEPISTSTGGAIQANGGSVSVIRSILANSTTNSAAGKDCDQFSPGTVTVTNTLIENNNDCTGSISSSSDPGLSALGNHGGPTLTMAITNVSPAYNTALTCDSITVDQRGVKRPQNSACDLGAFELIPFTFTDVPLDHWAWSYIEGLYAAGVTSGCSTSPMQYCPTMTVTRDQMAVFLLRAKYGSSYSPPMATGVFQDVPTDHWAAAWIEQLAAEGITAGCGSGNYCPAIPVTRDQMAVFLLRAEHGSGYSPPMATGVFQDVPTDHWAAAWIEQLAAEGITSGCSVTPSLYCPSISVARDQMAVFLVRTFKLAVP